MHISLRGHALPESYDDFQLLLANGALQTPACTRCRTAFTPTNVSTLMGWRETQITGWCEDCFDDVTADREGTDHAHT